jgi:hypothetical protein
VVAKLALLAAGLRDVVGFTLGLIWADVGRLAGRSADYRLAGRSADYRLAGRSAD